MKMDYDLIKAILEDIEKRHHGQDLIFVHAENLLDKKPEWEGRHVNYHIRLLFDDGLVKVQAWPPANNLDIPINRLTAEGHRVLEAMRNDTLWNKIKDSAVAAGISGLKQIPALAIKVALGATV